MTRGGNGFPPLPFNLGGAMNRVFVVFGRLLRRTDGQDLIEYGLPVALIALVAVAAVNSVGNTINAVFWQAIAASGV